MPQITNNNSQLTGNGVSIIILTKDASGHLDNLLSSFFATNTHSPVELIIVDHSSAQITNNNSQITETHNKSQLTTRDVVSKYITKGFIRHIRRNKNYTFSESCNYGAAKARHPYLLFLNDNIIYTEDVLGKTGPGRIIENALSTHKCINCFRADLPTIIIFGKDIA